MWPSEGNGKRGDIVSFGGTLILSCESDLLTSFILLRPEYFHGYFVIIFFSESRDDISQQYKTSKAIALYLFDRQLFVCIKEI
jgi:hypothetical protein